MFQSKRRDVLKQSGIEFPRFCHLLRCALQIDDIPERDRSHNRVQPACAVPLILKRSITDLAQPIEEHGSCQRPSPTLVQTGGDSPPQR